jgi:beta-mannosidase
MFKRSFLDWSVGPADGPSSEPGTFVPAVVPGAVQLDWARASGWQPPEYAQDVSVYSWMEDKHWLYRGRIGGEKPGSSERLFFVCKGIDYSYEIRLKGRQLLGREGMFSRVEIDLTGIAGPGDEIEVLIRPVPKSHALPADNHQPDRSCKPAVSYGWDFHPRLVPSGIWDEAFCEIRPVVHIRDVSLEVALNGDLSAAEFKVRAELSEAGSPEVVWELFSPSGERIVEQRVSPAGTGAEFRFVLDRPELWWPNGQGDQPLYRSDLSIVDPGSGRRGLQDSRRTGVKRLKLVMHPGGWEDREVNRVPKGPNKSPVAIEVNGRLVFGKGSNWVGPDIFPGRVGRERYRELLEPCRRANFNLLRCWGGAAVQKDDFFDLCDELGLMVWQEFPLACNRYEGTPEYLEVLDQESRAIIGRLRHHACLALWCGGNELFNPWSRMTDQDGAMRLLNSNCYTLDPQRPFLATSPVYGVGHGHYKFLIEDGRDVFQYFQAASCTAYVEFGVSAPSDAGELRKIIPDPDLFPPAPNAGWKARHGFEAWDGSKESWLELSTIRRYFGDHGDLEALVADGQMLQAEGLRSMFEEARRQKPVCSMALNWCYNEPWPTAANNSLVQWNGKEKPAFAAVASALRPVLASARVSRFDWAPGETFDPELWILNDSIEEYPGGTMTIRVLLEGKFLAGGEWNFGPVGADANLRGPGLSFELPPGKWSRLTLGLEVDGRPEWASEYRFLRRRVPPAPRG